MGVTRSVCALSISLAVSLVKATLPPARTVRSTNSSGTNASLSPSALDPHPATLGNLGANSSLAILGNLGANNSLATLGNLGANNNPATLGNLGAKDHPVRF